MRWQGKRRSANVEDRRGMSHKGLKLGGGLGSIIIVVLYLLLGGNPQQIMNINSVGVSSPYSGQEQVLSEKDREMGDFVSVVLADIEDVWKARFAELGMEYREPKLVLFTDQVQTAHGVADAATGPFYMPSDQTIYIDLAFFEEIQRKLGAPGDFALAYVIAHEVGHHVQNLLGINEQVQSAARRLNERDRNALNVRMELQADFLAGVWAHYAQRARDFLEAGDLEEGMNAAAAVGDDRIQQQTQGRVVPDAFTHGSSDQRVRWFRNGLQSGDIEQGDTFKARDL